MKRRELRTMMTAGTTQAGALHRDSRSSEIPHRSPNLDPTEERGARRRYAPVLVLVALAPAVSEVLFEAVPVTRFGSLPLIAALYGGGAAALVVIGLTALALAWPVSPVAPAPANEPLKNTRSLWLVTLIPLLAAGSSFALREVPTQVNAFLAETAATARRQFVGRTTYASGSWEDIDWSPFDTVAIDAYRGAHNAATYREELRRSFVHGKPVVASEFGCCTNRGAAPRYDLDMTSYGVVTILEQGRGSAYPDMGWEPKESFYALANAYAG